MARPILMVVFIKDVEFTRISIDHFFSKHMEQETAYWIDSKRTNFKCRSCGKHKAKKYYPLYINSENKFIVVNDKPLIGDTICRSCLNSSQQRNEKDGYYVWVEVIVQLRNRTLEDMESILFEDKLKLSQP